jgi:Uncharacterized protein conserved in bacteria (DUF2252)
LPAQPGGPMNVLAATRDYESWLAGLVPLHQPDLDYKHLRMADRSDPFPFFRGTYYLWARRWPDAAGDLAAAPAVQAVGDLHLENFGTWRDGDGRLCWGVNDFDEADHLPYTNDLVRLAVSMRLARQAGIARIRLGKACAAILAGYRWALSAGGVPFVLEEQHRKLRAMAMAADREPVRYWKRLTAVLADPPARMSVAAQEALTQALPSDALSPEFRFRPRVGMGSLGKPRYVALATLHGSWVAREAKALTPPATLWASGRYPGPSHLAETVSRAIRCPDPCYCPGSAWIVRRLAPRCSRIELDHLKRSGDILRLLRAMGAEAANVHVGTPGAAWAIEADLTRRPDGWLVEAARSLARLVKRDWTAWRKATR